MTKIGPKEAAQRDLQAKKLSRAHEMMLEDGCPPKCLRTGPGPKLKRRDDERSAGVTLAPPIAIQKAIAAEFAEDETETTNAPAQPAAQQEEPMMTTSKIMKILKKDQKAKKTAKPKRAKASTPKAASTSKENTGNGTSKKATVIGMLQTGATMDALTKATGWIPHSVHGLIGGLRAKNKMNITATKDGEGQNVYRIVT